MKINIEAYPKGRREKLVTEGRGGGEKVSGEGNLSSRGK